MSMSSHERRTFTSARSLISKVVSAKKRIDEHKEQNTFAFLQKRAPLISYLLWMTCGTLFYRFHEGYPFYVALYQSTSIGWAIGWDLPVEVTDTDVNMGTIYSCFHNLIGVLFVGVIVTYIEIAVSKTTDNWVVEMTKRQNITYVAPTTPAKRITRWIKLHKDRLVIYAVCSGSCLLCILFGYLTNSYSFAESCDMALSTLSCGGYQGMPLEAGQGPFIFLAIFTNVAVPVFLVAAGTMASIMMTAQDEESFYKKIASPITDTELEYMQYFGIENGDGVLDKKEFLSLIMIRIANVKPQHVLKIHEHYRKLTQNTAGVLIIDINSEKVANLKKMYSSKFDVKRMVRNGIRSISTRSISWAEDDGDEITQDVTNNHQRIFSRKNRVKPDLTTVEDHEVPVNDIEENVPVLPGHDVTDKVTDSGDKNDEIRAHNVVDEARMPTRRPKRLALSGHRVKLSQTAPMVMLSRELFQDCESLGSDDITDLKGDKCVRDCSANENIPPTKSTPLSQNKTCQDPESSLPTEEMSSVSQKRRDPFVVLRQYSRCSSAADDDPEESCTKTPRILPTLSTIDSGSVDKHDSSATIQPASLGPCYSGSGRKLFTYKNDRQSSYERTLELLGKGKGKILQFVSRTRRNRQRSMLRRSSVFNQQKIMNARKTLQKEMDLDNILVDNETKLCKALWMLIKDCMRDGYVQAFVFWVTWLVAGGLFYTFNMQMSFYRGFYMSVNVGYAIYWTTEEDSPSTKAFSVLNVILGQLVTTVALAYFAVRLKNDWYAEAEEKKRLDVVNEKSHLMYYILMKCVYFLRNNIIHCLSVIWLTFGVVWSLHAIEWSFMDALYFSVTSLSTGGIWSIPEDSSDVSYFIVALFTCTGAPILCLSAGLLAFALCRLSRESDFIEAMSSDISLEELEMMKLLDIDGNKNQVDLTEYVVLVLIRVKAVQPELIAAVLAHFQAIDEENEGHFTYDKIVSPSSAIKQSRFKKLMGNVLRTRSTESPEPKSK